MQPWVYWVLGVLGVLIVAFVIITQTSWFKVRKYAVDAKKIFDKYNLQQKAEAVQSLSQNPNPVLVKKPLNELISAYKGLIGEMEKVKAPAAAQEVHNDQLTMFRESQSLYQMALLGGFRQKSMQDKQKKLQNMERALTAKMEKLYGPMKQPKKK